MPCGDSGFSKAVSDSLDEQEKAQKPFEGKINLQAKIDYLTSLLCAQCSYLLSDSYKQSALCLSPLLEEVRKWYIDHKNCEEEE